MIRTEEDDEFDRIARENAMKGQPYHFDIYVSPSQRNQVLEEVAKMFDARDKDIGGWYDPHEPSEIIRGMKK
tara:strand:- start:635 stop:850 length:216 start_codon:yes stop_codon:yes gene_type:complete